MGSNQSILVLRGDLGRLSAETVPKDDDKFWQTFWTAPTSADDVFGIMNPSDIRVIMEKHLDNFLTLLEKGIRLLKDSCGRALDPVSKFNDFKPVLNVVRIVSRIAPFCFELEGSEERFASFFWMPRPDGVVLGTWAVESLLELLFVPGFTCRGKVKPLNKDSAARYDVPDDWIWDSGIGVSRSRTSSGSMDSNRTEILKCIQALCSHSLFVGGTQRQANLFIRAFGSAAAPRSRALFDSILNLVCSYEAIGWVPYSNFVFSDVREDLVTAALETFLLLLEDWNMDNIDVSEFKPPFGEVYDENATFCAIFQSLSNPQDLKFLTEGVLRLLWNPLKISQLYLPASRKEISFTKELFVLVWKALELNDHFRQFVVANGDFITRMVVAVLHTMVHSRKDETRVGLCYISAFILLLLSGERRFAVVLNARYSEKLDMSVPVFSGSYHDLLILVVHKVVTNGLPRLENLHESLLTVIANVSPYVSSSSMVACSKLLHMFEVFTQPHVLFSDSRRHRLVKFLLDTFNNIIQYQYEGNIQLVYTILRRHVFFDQLAQLSYEWYAAKERVTLTEVEQKEVSGEDEKNEVDSKKEEEKKEEILEGPSAESVTKNGKDDSVDDGVAVSARWEPSEEWFTSWHSQLPLNTVLRLLNVLLPQVSDFCAKTTPDEGSVLKFIQSTTLVGLLPVPHRIVIRRYQKDRGTAFWVTTFLWGVLYLRNVSPPLFHGTRVRLFVVTLAPTGK